MYLIDRELDKWDMLGLVIIGIILGGSHTVFNYCKGMPEWVELCF